MPKARSAVSPVPTPDIAALSKQLDGLRQNREETDSTLARSRRERGQAQLAEAGGTVKPVGARDTLSAKIDTLLSQRRALDDTIGAAEASLAAARVAAREGDLKSRNRRLAAFIETRLTLVADLESDADRIADTLGRIDSLDGEIAALGQGENLRLGGTAAADPREWQRRANRYFGLRLARFPAFANLQFWRSNGAEQSGWAARERLLASHITITATDRKN